MSVFVPVVLAEGLAPTDWDTYFKQQRRWARSMFNLVFYHYPCLIPRLAPRQSLAYLILGAFYFNHVAFVVLSAMPLVAICSWRTVANAAPWDCVLRGGMVVLPYLAVFTTCLLIERPGEVARRLPRFFGAGLLAIACWWEVLRALVRAIYLGRVVPLRDVTEKKMPVKSPEDRTISAPGVTRATPKLILPHFCWLVIDIVVLIYAAQQPAIATKGMLPFVFAGIVLQVVILLWALR